MLTEGQIKHLEETQEATLVRFDRRQERAIKNQGYGGTAGAIALTEAYVSQLSTIISDQITVATQAQSSRDPLWHLKTLSYVVRNLDPDVLAAATINSILHSIGMCRNLRGTLTNIGYALHGECWAAGLLRANAKLHSRISRAVKARHGSVPHRKQSARSIAKRAGYQGREWSRVELVLAGGWLLDCAERAMPDVLVREVAERGVQVPTLTERGLEIMEAAKDSVLQRYPVFVPCVQPPNPWTALRSGGYWDERAAFGAPFVRSFHKETHAAVASAMREGSAQPHVDGVNALQSVAWTINRPVLDVVQWCAKHAVEVKGLPGATDIPEPERLSDAEAEDAGKRRLQRFKVNQIKEHNRGLKSARLLLAEDIATASRLGNEQSFYTPFNCDWRGRVYSVPHFSFARDDRVRSLFLFANGMPIGEEGLWWLKVHTANCYGVDKVSFEERVAWTEEHLSRITDVAWDAKSTHSLSWWTAADKPFLFLAACLELAAAKEKGASYVTRLPISFDGSCSGLQHLCAMTRAAEGSLVNLCPNDRPQDVYQTVADLVSTRITADAARGTASETSALARLCLAAGIDRKLVKRNVMTFAYSSEEYGMGQQHLEDTMRPLELKVLAGDLAAHPYAHEDDTRETADGRTYTVVGRAAAKYLAGHIYDAIRQVVERPAAAMAFLQRCARAMAHEGKPLSWTTPTGLPWVNRYHEPTVKRVELWLSDTKIRINVADGVTKKIDKDKSSNGVAPNFVHALDAAHLILTVNAAVREGIHQIATVHDSFGCLAPQAKRFNEIIREQFVQMYEQHDVLNEVLEAAKCDLTVHNWGRLPEPLAHGPLQLKDVMNAKYCFA